MASTAGRKAKPLPPSIIHTLAELGYRKMEIPAAGDHYYRHPTWPDLWFRANTLNTPGHTDIVAEWKGQKPTRMAADMVSAKLILQIESLKHPNQFMEAQRG